MSRAEDGPAGPPPATGQRITWAELPADVRAGVERIIGDGVVHTDSQSGGFSPGTADRVRTSHGRRAFVKAVSPDQNPDSPDLLRTEADHLAAFSASAYVPELIGRFDDGYWIAVVMEDIDGACPPVPWTSDHVELAMAALAGLAADLTPSPLPGLRSARSSLTSLFTGWHRIQTDPFDTCDRWVAGHLDQLAELADSALARLEGETVVHLDVRADNLLVRPDGSVVVVDWPWAAVGPDWLDRFLLMINIDLYGGLDAEPLVGQHLGDVDPELITGALAGMCAFFTDAGRQPPVPGLPTLRAFQQAQADSTTAWLRRRLGRRHGSGRAASASRSGSVVPPSTRSSRGCSAGP